MKADHIVEALTGDSGWRNMIPQVDSSDFPTQWVPSAYECSIIEAQAKEIEKLRAQLRHLCRDCDLERLEKLAEADRAGRLAVLPCKAGNTVYEVTSRKTISEYRVKAIRVELFCTFIEWDIVAGFVDKSIFGVPVDEIGKTVFLTHEEAKKALEAMKDD